jgi:hypothetical protein
MQIIEATEKFLSSSAFGDDTLINSDFSAFLRAILRAYDQDDLTALLEPTASATDRICVAGACTLALAEDRGDRCPSTAFAATRNALRRKNSSVILSHGEVPVLCPNDGVDCLALHLIEHRFRDNLAKSDCPTPMAELVTPTDYFQKTLSAAIQTLNAALPTLAVPVLANLSGLLLIKNSVQSAFVSPSPYLIYVDAKRRWSPADLADTIFHEALHHKLFAIRCSRGLFFSNYTEFADVRVPIPWGGCGEFRHFSVGRALAAAHVYVHVAVLQFAFINRLAFSSLHQIDREESAKRFASHASRALYLLDVLQDREMNFPLSACGLQLVRWLRTSFDMLISSAEAEEPLHTHIEAFKSYGESNTEYALS